MNENFLDTLNEQAMQMILKAGDARALITQSYDELKNKNIEAFEKILEDAHEKLVEAHRIQTKCIQDQIEMEENLYSVLFSHAQDTLMTVNSEYEMTKRIAILFLKE